MRFWIAWQLLTVVPAPARFREFGPEDIGRSVSLFPVIGLVLGLLLFGIDYGLGLLVPTILTSALLVLALAILTGALHLDGFIDTCDGLVLRRSASEKLSIMADSRVGAFGVVGVCCLLLTKYAALVALPPELRWSVLILMPVLSRWVTVCGIQVFPAAKKDGMGWAAKQKSGWKGVAAATLVAAGLAILLLSWWGAVLMGSLYVVVWLIARFLSSKFGGLTGDCYGAINELAELAVLLLACLVPVFGGAPWLV